MSPEYAGQSLLASAARAPIVQMASAEMASAANVTNLRRMASLLLPRGLVLGLALGRCRPRTARSVPDLASVARGRLPSGGAKPRRSAGIVGLFAVGIG